MGTRKPVTIDACMANPPDAEFLRHYLADRDAACANCGYNLRGLTNDRCPECGLGLVLQIGLQEPRQGAFLAGVVGLAAGVGFSGLILLYVLITVARGRGFPPGTLILICSIGLAVEGLALAVWTRHRAQLRAMSARRRIFWGCFCWVLTLINLCVFEFFEP